MRDRQTTLPTDCANLRDEPAFGKKWGAITGGRIQHTLRVLACPQALPRRHRPATR